MTTLALSAANNATWSYGPVALLDKLSAPLALPTGTLIEMHLRSSADDINLVLGLSLANGRLNIIDLNAATIGIEVPASAMRDVAAGSYAYDITVTQPSGRVHRPIDGVATIIQGVTR